MSIPPTKSLEEDMHLTAWSSDEFEDPEALLSTIPILLAKDIVEIPCYRTRALKKKKKKPCMRQIHGC